ncbi:cobyrinic acid a,c-diamide synthase [Thermoanaerobacterium thermosaccharolyticum DSM 571]|uniref:Cobyrinate a,c-diamide synthase n=1 Tax=Thermoanaerobacterium thermosaccharolyticum (strain ATCC 7956 / DSM 571 / NCIMB 9385 / NCA 3814 / NCTC 13789 / WDCM 00135 / 2032) TaxID=580327 RepID=D9TQV9_THETC|nr:cobyrinate a,c-diamide synthase [Thermoanaerobacterium thermosaccharolyticum]ADL69739.1 cobyrinic acid a,c-diamide synthase [Thermoanaerobacterium thermosaccharolyticum DSM 571]
MCKAFMIAGTHSGVGKTTITIGIIGYLSKKQKVIPFKIGPDYIDAAYHRFASGNSAYNLDVYMLGDDYVKKSFLKHALSGDVALVEGVMGMYDGINNTSYGSSAHVAKLLNLPVVLVVDASGMAASVSALIKGYIEYDRDVKIAGVIFNRVGGEKHYKLLKECIERDLGIKAFGYLPHDDRISLPERHLGLMPIFEIKENHNFSILYDSIGEFIDVEGILDVCDVNFKKDDLIEEKVTAKTRETVKIAIAYDEAFNFYYQDSFDALKEAGAELLPFSPLHDEALPKDISGIYIGGGFPEVFADKLSQNVRMLSLLKHNIDIGMPVYAECGGLMYLTKRIIDLDGNEHKMIGVFDLDAIMTKRLINFGYVEADVLQDNVLFKKGDVAMGHVFHNSKVSGEFNNFAYDVHKPNSKENWLCGYVYKNCLATYVHVNLFSYPNAVNRFIGKCKNYAAGDV